MIDNMFFSVPLRQSAKHAAIANLIVKHKLLKWNSIGSTAISGGRRWGWGSCSRSLASSLRSFEISSHSFSSDDRISRSEKEVKQKSHSSHVVLN
eukprot:847698-Amphidinium_carterae.1